MPETRQAQPPIRVLLVDDHFAMRLGLRATLHGATGIDVVGEARSGEEALVLAGSLAPDVVVMDVSMTGLGGIEATRQIRAAHPAIRVIGMSMYDERDAGDAMRQAGAVAYVKKTEARACLVETIRQHGR
jgi:DNA-binding NarL/FixJ family response regulator